MVSLLGTETSPSSGTSSSTIMRKSVVFPEPLGPTRPTFSPGFNWKEASTKTNCLPYCLLILEKEIIDGEKRAEYTKLAEASKCPGPQGTIISRFFHGRFTKLESSR